MQSYPTKQDKQLIHALMLLENKQEVKDFLRDLLTASEISEFSRRFEIARLLWTTNKSYLDIATLMKTSTSTVTRVYQWLYKEPTHGYSAVLERMFGKSKR